MRSELPVVTKSVNKNGIIEYHVWAVSGWDGLESLAKYLQKYWRAEISEAVDKIYSRRWVLRVEDVPISLYYDGQVGNFFFREDGLEDQALMEKIEADLIKRLG